MTASFPTSFDGLLIVPWANQGGANDPTTPVNITASQTTLGAGTPAALQGGTYSHTTTTTSAENVAGFSFTIPPGTAYRFIAHAIGTDGAGNRYFADHSFGLARNASGSVALIGSSTETATGVETDGSGSGWTGLTFVNSSSIITAQVTSAVGVLWKIAVQVQ